MPQPNHLENEVYTGRLNQEDPQENISSDDARPFYPERTERIERPRTHWETCYRVHPECAFAWIAEHDGDNARWHSFETVQAIVKERDALRADLGAARDELASIQHAAHMPEEYQFGLPSWINQVLYACYISAAKTLRVGVHLVNLVTRTSCSK